MSENNFVSDTLTQWGFADFSAKFKEEEIDEEAFMNLDENTITEIIPKIGARAKFLKKWRELVATHNEKKENPADEPIRTIHDENPKDDNITAPVCCSSSSSFLQTLLEESVHGKQILDTYERQKTLNLSARSKLAELIINHELQNNNENRISTERFLQLTDLIVELFPSEHKATYYTPFVKVGGVTCNAKGKLYAKYYNTRRVLTKNGLLKKQTVLDENVSDPLILSDADPDMSNDELNEKLLWLAHSLEPWPKVLQFWEATSRLRSHYMAKNTLRIDEYMKKYPAIQQPLGYNLLEIDFGISFKKTEHNLLRYWPEYCDKLLTLAEKQQNDMKHLKHYLDILKTNDENDTKSNIGLRILPLMMSVCTIRKKQGIWRASRVEVQDSFVTHLLNVCNLKTTIEKRTAKMLNLGLTVQPYVIIVGPTLSSIEASYVVINNVIYKLESPLKALDVCFKAFHVLCVMYPPECEQIWLFLQKVIYKLETQWDKRKGTKQFVGLHTLMSDIGE